MVPGAVLLKKVGNLWGFGGGWGWDSGNLWGFGGGILATIQTDACITQSHILLLMASLIHNGKL